MPPLNTFNKTKLTLAVAQVLAVASANAATIFVDDFSDSNGANCTLRQAIVSANTNSTAAGSSCVAGDGNDTIRFRNTEATTIGLTQGALDITHDLSIQGPYHSPIVIDGTANNTTFIDGTVSNLSLMHI